MRLWARVRNGFRSIFRSSQLERELDDELRFTLDELTARHAARGLTPERARRVAQREPGALDLIKEDVRAGGIGHHLETILRDAAYAWAGLVRAPGFARQRLAALPAVEAVGASSHLPYDRSPTGAHRTCPRMSPTSGRRASRTPARSAPAPVRSTTPAEDLVPAVRAIVGELDPALPVYDVRPLRSYTAEALATRMFTLIVAAAFAVSALLLTAVGVYGVVSNAVAQRRREFAVRVALGARAGQVMRLVLGDGLRLTIAGALIGCVLAVAAAGLISTQLYGITPYDPLTFLAGVAFVIAAALLACWLPARRAARMNPVLSLHD